MQALGREDVRVGRPEGPPSEFTCPRCRGTIWEKEGHESLSFGCRIGHEFSLAAMLAEHSVARRAHLTEGGRWLAEGAALQHRLAAWAREQGHALAAERLDAEAVVLEEWAAEVLQRAVSPLFPTEELFVSA